MLDEDKPLAVGIDTVTTLDPENIANTGAVKDKKNKIRARIAANEEAKLFSTEAEARQYLEEHVPPVEEDKEVDFSQLKESLYTAPKTLSPGHYEFEGRNGLKISFDITEAVEAEFNACSGIFGKLFDDGDIVGEFRPIYEIRNLNIGTEHFSYNLENHSRRVEVIWQPGLRSTNSELSHAFVHTDKGIIYLIGESGLLARPKDLLTLFHELGHIETRTPKALVDERNSVRRTYSASGLKTEPLKEAALELQREIDANEWMTQKTRELFDDLDITRTLIGDHVQHAQLRSYYIVNRRRLAKYPKEQ